MVLASPFWTALRLFLHGVAALRGRGAAGKLAGERSAFHLVAVTLRAWLGALRLLPHALRQRRRIASFRKIDRSALTRLLRAHRLGAREVAFKD